MQSRSSSLSESSVTLDEKSTTTPRSSSAKPPSSILQTSTSKGADSASTSSPSRSLVPSAGGGPVVTGAIYPGTPQQVPILGHTADEFDDDGVPLDSAALKNEIARLEGMIIYEEESRLRAQDDRRRQEEIRIRVSKEESNFARNQFLEQADFRWSLPENVSGLLEKKVVDGYRVPPESPMAVVPKIPPLPPPLASLPEQDTAYAERYSALVLHREVASCQRRIGAFDLEETFFSVPSSDDSEGYDEDFDAEWRGEITNDIFRGCRALQCDFTNEEAVNNFIELLNRVQEEEDITPTERSMMWDTIRYCYRQAEPLHHKHWLASCHEIVDTGGFYTRPSVTNFLSVIRAATLVQCFTERQKQKIEGWARRALFLTQKRICVLQEFGDEEPTWERLNVSCGGLSRNVKVPTMTLEDMMRCLTQNSQQVVPPSSVQKPDHKEEEAPTGK